MVGGGNVDLIVAYQQAQAGARVRAVVEIAPTVGGYYVHAAKVQRRGIPILTSHAVARAVGSARVEAVGVAPVEAIGASEFVRTIPAQTVCLAVGLTPRSELAALAGCGTLDCPALGGPVLIHSEDLETTAPGVFVAEAAAGVEEASTALDEGRLAGLAVAERLGKLPPAQAGPLKDACRARLYELRLGRDLGAGSRPSWPWPAHVRIPAGRRARAAASSREVRELDWDTTICRCEEVTVADIAAAFAAGARTLKAIKQVTRAGVGDCQGKTRQRLAPRCWPTCSAAAALTCSRTRRGFRSSLPPWES